MGSEPYLAVHSLSRVFDVSKPWPGRLIEGRRLLRAVDGVSFAIAKGETFALVGESGSGKTTLARMIAGLIAPTDGVVTFGEEDRQRRVQMIFQDPFSSLNPRWRAAQIISEPIRAYGLICGEVAIASRVANLLAMVGLHAGDAVKYPHEFSGGQRQRLAIARALAAEAEFIICDEPTSALDVSVQAQILNLMRDLQERLGLTYLFISHHLAVVRFIAARAGVMYLGRLVETATTAALLSAPRHPYTRMLLASVPDLNRGPLSGAALPGELPNPLDPPSGCAFHPRCPLADARCRAEQPALIDGVACHAVTEKRA